MYTDPISDFLTRLRNAQAAGHETTTVPGSKLKLAIAKILEREGFVGSVKESNVGPKKTIEVGLKYNEKEPAIRAVKRVSTPGRRVYRGADELPNVLSGQGIAIISTSAGVMTNREARRRRLGGEILCEVY
ncbi:30S ribosomal protein S8 [Patescibacteria group bacterium]|jgi:small subunit ribosomal protein S8|nr:30S ribosomal protein S8 [Candidatus Uhrbacteria bacterium]MCK9361190.1 30S ribosomal protein S8 [Patescibacteria group bacterium]